MKTKALLTVAVCLCVAGLFIACGGGANVTVNTPAKNAAPAANTAAPASAPSSAAPASSDSTAAAPNTGVPECDDYIKKYEACLTKIAKAAPQVEEGMKKAFETTRDGWKKAAANPTTKATLASACKTATDSAKTQMKQYACEF